MTLAAEVVHLEEPVRAVGIDDDLVWYAGPVEPTSTGSQPNSTAALDEPWTIRHHPKH
jgi:hypothetical protein